MKTSRQIRGYALLDVVLAVALFAITVTGLVQVMQKINETSGGFARDRLIQQQIEATLAEMRQRDVEEMTSERYDERLDITVRSYVEPFEVDNGEGRELRDLYKLTVEAAFVDEGGEQLERADLLIYKEDS